MSVVMFIVLLALFEGTKKKFIVLGAHSSKNSWAYFRPLRAPKYLGSTPGIKMNGIKRKPAIAKSKLKAKPRILELKKKLPLKKVQPKVKIEPVQKKVAPKKVEKKKEEVIQKKEEPKPKEEVKQEVKSAQEEPIPIELGGSAIVSRLQQEVQREISRAWRPPVGVPKGTECVLLVEVDQTGEIKKYELAERSKVLIYDLSVLQAAREFKFSKSLWGNSLLVTFRQ
ncbi:TonB C-terminal domain-containing protein [Candidatus Babeliales bacterium]|nr:TonB C-terminal domain-containing protein [Candidatus Babeliales bacterium]